MTENKHIIMPISSINILFVRNTLCKIKKWLKMVYFRTIWLAFTFLIDVIKFHGTENAEYRTNFSVMFLHEKWNILPPTE